MAWRETAAHRDTLAEGRALIIAERLGSDMAAQGRTTRAALVALAMDALASLAPAASAAANDAQRYYLKDATTSAREAASAASWAASALSVCERLSECVRRASA